MTEKTTFREHIVQDLGVCPQGIQDLGVCPQGIPRESSDNRMEGRVRHEAL